MNESSGCRTSLHSPLRIAKDALGAVFCLLCSISFLQAAERTSRFDVTYESKSRLVSVSAQSIPLADVLHALAAKTGLDINVDPSVSSNVLQHFNDVPLEQAINRLTGSHQTLLVYGTGEDTQQLRKVHVMARAERVMPRAPAAPDLNALNVYGLTWLAAHHDSDPRLLPAATIEAALSWQKYLGQLTDTQRAQLHERMLRAREARTKAGQLAATLLRYR